MTGPAGLIPPFMSALRSRDKRVQRPTIRPLLPSRSHMRSLFALAVFLAATTLALAEPTEIRPEAPIATFDIPDAWETSQISRGIEAVSPDKEVYLWVEAYEPDQFKA